jgi:hypothetical protein
MNRFSKMSNKERMELFFSNRQEYFELKYWWVIWVQVAMAAVLVAVALATLILR